MTSAQLMPSGIARFAAAIVMFFALAAGGCLFRSTLTQPTLLSSPYGPRQLWAVSPFLNESGSSIADGVRTADLFTQQLEQVRGIDTVPINRVLLAMRVNEIASVTSPAEAVALMRTLGVDGLVVGTITAYDPYRPPTLGASIQLFAADAAGGTPVDPRELTRARSGVPSPGTMGPSHAVAEAAGVFDSRNHETLTWLSEYAAGRTEPGSAFGTEIYLVDMELYTQFVSYRLIHDLLAFELARMTPQESQAPAP